MSVIEFILASMVIICLLCSTSAAVFSVVVARGTRTMVKRPPDHKSDSGGDNSDLRDEILQNFRERLTTSRETMVRDLIGDDLRKLQQDLERLKARVDSERHDHLRAIVATEMYLIDNREQFAESYERTGGIN